ncbi:MAG: heparinase II/III family protein [Spirochaetes bacterium]|nr:heparinase II/III family protein [Spirochaetota bacterium]
MGHPASPETERIEVNLDAMPPWKGALRYVPFPWEAILSSPDPEIQRITQAIRSKAAEQLPDGIMHRPQCVADIHPPMVLDGRAKNAGPHETVFALANADVRLWLDYRLGARLMNLAFCARLGEDPRSQALLLDQLSVVAAEFRPLQRSGWTAYDPNRPLPAEGDGVWLATGAGILALVRILDLMGDRVPAPLRADLKRNLRQEIALIVESWEKKIPWYVKKQTYRSNQWAMPLCGLVYACLYLGDESLRPAYELGVLGLAKTLLAQGEGGSWSEGYSYAAFTLQDVLEVVHAMVRAGDPRLADLPMLRAFDSWFAQMRLTGPYLVNPYDSGHGLAGSHPWPALLLGSLITRNPQTRHAVHRGWLGERYSEDWFSLVYLHLAKDIPEAAATPTHAFYPAQQLLVWRRAWDHENAMALWIRGGSGNDFHLHDDGGHLSLYRGPEAILVEAGTPDYSTPDFNRLYRGQKGHNILQTPGARCERFPTEMPAVAVPVRIESLGAEGGRVFIDGRQAYDDVAHWIRRIEWSASGWVILEDEARLTKTQEAGHEWFRFHTGCHEPLKPTATNDREWVVAWPSARIRILADAPIRVRSVPWPNAVLHPEIQCLLVEAVDSRDQLRLETRIDLVE